MPLDISPLVNAIERLDEGLKRYNADTSDTQIRDGLIQRFEFTYDLAHKMIRRVIEAGAANPEAVDRMNFPELIRTADELELIGSDWPQWRKWRDMRNVTSHTYDEAKALEVTGGIPCFLVEAREVATRLQADIDR